MACAMISFSRKLFWGLVFIFGSTSFGFAQTGFFEVVYTPYDHQMARIQPVLTSPPHYAANRISLALVNGWMIDLRGMPYRYSHQWRTPFEVEIAKTADCKGKALVLYDRMQLYGATNLRFVIGKRRTTDSLTHAWLEWDTTGGTLLLDPTFNWTASFKTPDQWSYVAFYSYAGSHKYQAAGSLLARNSLARRTPAAPAHGVTIRPSRSISTIRSTQMAMNQAAVAPRSYSNGSLVLSVQGLRRVR